MLEKHNKEALYKFYSEKGKYFNEYGDTPFYKLNLFLNYIRKEEIEFCKSANIDHDVRD